MLQSLVICSSGWSFLTVSDALLTALEQIENGEEKQDLMTEVQSANMH